MIFNNKIDKAIRLMLVADKENSDNIIKFITNMPDELKNKILEKIEVLNEYKKSGIKNFSFLCGECDIDNKFLYSFEIDPYFEELDMGYMECLNGIYRDVFKMSLCLSDVAESVKKSYIGSIEYNINVKNVDGLFNLIDSSLNEYILIKTSLGYVVVYSKDDNKSIRNHFRFIGFMDMDEELYLDNIKDKTSGKIRRRKK